MIYRIVVCSGDGPGIDIYGPDAEMAVLDPHLEIELNSAGSLEFTLPVDNINWNIPNVFQNEIEVWEDDKIIWFGRPLQIIRDWNNQRRVVCEGALSYFNDTIQRTWEQQPATNKTNISFFKHLISVHNNDTENNKHFVEDNITVESVPAYRKTDYETTLDCLQNMCLSTDGGYFILRKEYDFDPSSQKDVATRYIDWYENLPENSMQDVQFGYNLLDITQDLNGADICTVLIPSGKDDVMLNNLGNKNPSDNDGVGHNSGSDEIYYQPGIDVYGRVVQQKSWNDYSDINEVWRKAKEWLIDKNTDIPTIECSAADLYYITDPSMPVDGPLQVGMNVQVVSAPHDFNKKLMMYKISMDLDSGIKKVTLGTPPKKELTDIVAPNSGGNSTSGNGGKGGGSGESGSGSGSGQTVIAPVQDVKVKLPGETEYSSAVKKKVAKIDLTNVGKVDDVKVDGESVVDSNKVANISIPVKDVKVDNVSILDSEGVAQIDSDDFGKVDDVLVDGLSVVRNKVAEIEGAYVNYPDLELIAEINDDTEDYYTDSSKPGWRGYTLDYHPDEHETSAYLFVCLARECPYPSIIRGYISEHWSPFENWSDTYMIRPSEELDLRSDDGTYYDSEGQASGDSYAQSIIYLFNDVASPSNMSKSRYIKFSVRIDDRQATVNTNILMRDVKNYLFRILVYKINGLKSGVCGKVIKHELASLYNTESELPSFPQDSFIREHTNSSEIFLHYLGMLGGKNTEVYSDYNYDDTVHPSYMKNIRISSDLTERFNYNQKQAAVTIDKCTKTTNVRHVPYEGSIGSPYNVTCAFLCIHFYVANTEVVANPDETATDVLEKIKVQDVVYDIPQGGSSGVIPNPQEPATQNLNTVKINSIVYDIPKTDIEPNPQEPATDDLDTIKIDNDIFRIAGGTPVVANPETPPLTRLNTIQIGETTYRVSSGSGDKTELDFYYTGDIQTFTAPENGTYTLEVWGAQGGSPSNDVHGGYGGYSVGDIYLNEGDTIYICVGGAGGNESTDPAAYNGGGLANYEGSRGNGGGATHIATATGELSDLSSNQSAVIIVAGGGGGAGYYGYGDSGDGGSGGGFVGGHGLFNGSPTGDGNSNTGSGGTQSAGGSTETYSGQSHGSFGQGASRDDGDLWGGSGGGGGWYGGGASTNNAGAGGGSGYINTSVLSDAAMYGYNVETSSSSATKTYSVSRYSSDPTSQVAKEGDGHARISYGGGNFDPYVSVGDLYDACVANNVTPVSRSLTDIVAALLGN